MAKDSTGPNTTFDSIHANSCKEMQNSVIVYTDFNITGKCQPSWESSFFVQALQYKV
jgi:hypothetical protein